MPFRIATNFGPIFEIAGQTFGRSRQLPGEAFCLRIWVDRHANVTPPWPRPYLRGSESLVYASFGEGNFLLNDLKSRRIVGRFSPAMANDASYWTRVIFPMLMSLISTAIGIAELHCACVAKEGRGMLLAGPSGSGKSTLSVALARLGLKFISDDRTFCTFRNGGLNAWAPLADLKLRREAIGWFPEIADRLPSAGDCAELRLAPETMPFLNRAQECEPCQIIFLEPSSGGPEFCAISRTEVRERLSCELPPEINGSTCEQIISALSCLPAVKLQCSGNPAQAARSLIRQFCSVEPRTHNYRKGLAPVQNAPASMEHSMPRSRCFTAASAGATETQRHISDPLRRFAPAEHMAVLSVMGKAVKLETNNVRVLRAIRQLVSIYPACGNKDPDFRWRIFTDAGGGNKPQVFTRFTFSDPGLRFAQFGHRCFIAMDINSRQALAYVSEEMVSEKLVFASPFLDSLFCMCAARLGFLPLFSNCVAKNGKGILLMGGPATGKTTISYLASKRGLKLHADEGVFTEVCDTRLRAWGGFWPVIFRREASELFPELSTSALPYSYHRFTYYYLDKARFENNHSQPVTPVACVFLRRSNRPDIHLSALEPRRVRSCLSKSLLFHEEKLFRMEHGAIKRQLTELPAYEVEYGQDPSALTDVIIDLLARHS